MCIKCSLCSTVSGWTLDAVVDITIHMAAYQPLHGATYLPTPQKIVSRKAIVKVRNYDDNKCFVWAVLASLYPATRNAERLSNYTNYESDLDMTGIAFPVTVGDIYRFERQNAMSVNIFGWDGTVYPLHITKLHDQPHHVNLLILADGEGRHHCLIKNLSRLIAPRTGHDGVSFPCVYCLHVFCRADLLAEHVPHCKPHGPQQIKMPSGDDASLFFHHEDHQLRAPFVIYMPLSSVSHNLYIHMSRTLTATSSMNRRGIAITSSATTPATSLHRRCTAVPTSLTTSSRRCNTSTVSSTPRSTAPSRW